MATHSSILAGKSHGQRSLVGYSPQSQTRLKWLSMHTSISWIFPVGAGSKEPVCNAGDTGDPDSVPRWRRFPGGGHGNPLQYSFLDNSQGQRSLLGHSSQSHKELDTTEETQHICMHPFLVVGHVSSSLHQNKKEEDIQQLREIR